MAARVSPPPQGARPASAWTKTQARFLGVLAQEKNRSLPLAELVRQAGFKSHSSWDKAKTDPRFVDALERLGVRVSRCHAPHATVALAPDPDEELAKDVWDLRRLKRDYPKHAPPGDFVVDFTFLAPPLRSQVKQYFTLHLARWKARSFRAILKAMKPLLRLLAPDLHAGTLARGDIEAVLPTVLQLSDYAATKSVRFAKKMFDYMATSPAWTGPRPPRFLIWAEDIPPYPEALPRPIPPDVVEQFDALLARAVAAGESPPILSPTLWDALLILRRTGMRAEDLAHLIEPAGDGRQGCLSQDPDGYWWIRIGPHNTKMGREHRIPTRQSDGTLDAIHRQCARVQGIPARYDQPYLFRTADGVLTYQALWHALELLGAHLAHEGRPYRITPHQFRHTIATDMIQEGVDIYTVKEFLGHKSLAMTQKYATLYLDTLHKGYMTYRAAKDEQGYDSGASALIGSQVDVTPETEEPDAGWMPGQVGSMYVSPLPGGEGLCRHLAMLDPCGTTPGCWVCPKLVALRRHLPAWQLRVARLQTTVHALDGSPSYAPAKNLHEKQLTHARNVVRTIEQKGRYDGRIDRQDCLAQRPSAPHGAAEVGTEASSHT